ncbi:MAG: flagellar biosynthesis protein FliQ [Alphaproteobacteria bacterium]|nr:flagellar biosynthesis protein FliQ [Alphaproteobacteria bacterium]
MQETEVIDVAREALWTMMIVGWPMMITALIVGLAVSLFQALTQIQEMTLTFVPKVIAMVFIMMLTLPFMLNTLRDFNNNLYERIANIE